MKKFGLLPLLIFLTAPATAATICGSGTLLTTFNPFTNKLDYVCVGGGSGTAASSLAVGTGTATNFTTQISSPTAAISFLGSQFRSVVNGTTNFVSIDPSIFATTLPLPPGDTNYIQNRTTFQGNGTTFYVASGTVRGQFNMQSAPTGNVTSYFRIEPQTNSFGDPTTISGWGTSNGLTIRAVDNPNSVTNYAGINLQQSGGLNFTTWQDVNPEVLWNEGYHLFNSTGTTSFANPNASASGIVTVLKALNSSANPNIFVVGQDDGAGNIVHEFKVDTSSITSESSHVFLSSVTLTKALMLNGNPGTINQVPISNGPGAAPSWANQSASGAVSISTLTAGATNFVFNQNTLQIGSTFYTASGNIDQSLTINGNNGNSGMSLVDRGITVNFGTYTITGASNSFIVQGIINGSTTPIFQADPTANLVTSSVPFVARTTSTFNGAMIDGTGSAGTSSVSFWGSRGSGLSPTWQTPPTGVSLSSTQTWTAQQSWVSLAPSTFSALNVLTLTSSTDTAHAVPVITACGTGFSLSGGATDISGLITAGTGANSCAVTFGTAKPKTPACVAMTSQGNTVLTMAVTTSGFTITSLASFGSSVLPYICLGNQ